jgi:hypothetical protein
MQKAVYSCSGDNLSIFVGTNVLREIFILAAELFLIDGYYPLNITDKLSDEAIVKAQCFYYKQLLLMIRYCYIKETSNETTTQFDQ